MIIGEESGDDCSARVEWCRFVQALEKSSPRECLGSDVAGDAFNVSNCGDNGTRVVAMGAAIGTARGGICNDSPRPRSGLFGVCGEGTSWSSLDMLFLEIHVS